MNVLRRYSLGLGRAAVLVTAVVVAAMGVVQDAAPVKGGPTAEIIISLSNTVPIRAGTIILNPGGTSRELYMWVVGVDDPSGVSAYNLELYFDGTYFKMMSFVGSSVWLSSTNRNGACAPPGTIEPPPPASANHAYLSCVTIGAAPPFGPNGDGLLAKLVIRPGVAMGTASVLDLSAAENGGTFLLNTPANPDDCFPIQPECFVPVTLINSTIIFLNCGDNNGDGVIDLTNDILGVILRYQMTDSHPDWDPAFDLDTNGVIDLSNDILGTILQYQLPCLQNP